jgi:hypothetical protein
LSIGAGNGRDADEAVSRCKPPNLAISDLVVDWLGNGRSTENKWRAKFGGMEVSDAKKLKALEAENAKLKKLLAEQMMDVSTLKEMLGKNF